MSCSGRSRPERDRLRPDTNKPSDPGTDPTTGSVTTVAGTDNAGYADGPGASAQFNGPTGVTVAPDGTIYVADFFNHRIRAINPTTG
ncbi:MAG: hypothetical protein IPH81_03995 [Candidatus Microthrix sp.]|nr:hypothetical protein [Candidatus Microthrix sp.]